MSDTHGFHRRLRVPAGEPQIRMLEGWSLFCARTVKSSPVSFGVWLMARTFSSIAVTRSVTAKPGRAASEAAHLVYALGMLNPRSALLFANMSVLHLRFCGLVSGNALSAQDLCEGQSREGTRVATSDSDRDRCQVLTKHPRHCKVAGRTEGQLPSWRSYMWRLEGVWSALRDGRRLVCTCCVPPRSFRGFQPCLLLRLGPRCAITADSWWC